MDDQVVGLQVMFSEEGLPYQRCHAVDVEHSQSKYVHDTNNHSSGVMEGRGGDEVRMEKCERR